MKKVAILQSNYIPWKGYFDIINSVDEFIIYDDMQYTKRDWRNRNKIKTKDGLQWLSIPVIVKGKFSQPINETLVCNDSWIELHSKTIFHNYKRAKYFDNYWEWLLSVYTICEGEQYLSVINQCFIKAICEELGIRTKISLSTEYSLREGKTERLVGLCEDAGADYYLSGPAAKGYIVDAVFEKAGIELSYMDYSDYPPYSQLYGEFEHGVSIIDLILNEGENAPLFMKSFVSDR